ncbi:hypothetical protein Leryth_003258 [Lithospermum erythrorhizon]|nr:hypothetical protein Leryth_003258 [Lithospermum erythrorhizon]
MRAQRMHPNVYTYTVINGWLLLKLAIQGFFGGLGGATFIKTFCDMKTPAVLLLMFTLIALF